MSKLLTDREIKASILNGKPSWLSESRGRGNGSLCLKVSTHGAWWYYRHMANAKQVFLPLEKQYGDRENGLSLQEARGEVEKLIAEMRNSPGGDIKTKRIQEAKRHQAQHEAERLVVEHARCEHETRGKYTLGKLLTAYVRFLRHTGKNKTASDVENIFKNHINIPFPDFVSSPARNLTGKQVAQILRRVVDAGHGRTAAKLRSYLRAGYALAARAENDATVPEELMGFDVETNPVASTASLSQFNKAKDRALSEFEMHHLWKRIHSDDSSAGLVMRLALLSGGQRCEQLLRIKLDDVNIDDCTIKLLDNKGRRIVSRIHIVALGPLGIEYVKNLIERAKMLGCSWLFSSDGKKPVTASTVGKGASALSAAMVAAGEAESVFQFADFRRSIETALARYGISKEIRAQLQSHGLGGIQDRHYDRHDYLIEKRKAIELVERLLTMNSAQRVISIRVNGI
ncbi:MAG: tyrosine-type recombinase/integrase [Thiobacillus sp.]